MIIFLFKTKSITKIVRDLSTVMILKFDFMIKNGALGKNLFA